MYLCHTALLFLLYAFERVFWWKIGQRHVWEEWQSMVIYGQKDRSWWHHVDSNQTSLGPSSSKFHGMWKKQKTCLNPVALILCDLKPSGWPTIPLSCVVLKSELKVPLASVPMSGAQHLGHCIDLDQLWLSCHGGKRDEVRKQTFLIPWHRIKGRAKESVKRSWLQHVKRRHWGEPTQPPTCSGVGEQCHLSARRSTCSSASSSDGAISMPGKPRARSQFKPAKWSQESTWTRAGCQLVQNSQPLQVLQFEELFYISTLSSPHLKSNHKTVDANEV